MRARFTCAIALSIVLISPALASDFIPSKCTLPHCAVTAVGEQWPESKFANVLPLDIGPGLAMGFPAVPSRMLHDRDVLRLDFGDARLVVQSVDAQSLELPAAHGFNPEETDFVEYLQIAFEMTPEAEPKTGTPELVGGRCARVQKARQRVAGGARPGGMGRGGLVAYSFEAEPLRGSESWVAFVANRKAPYGFIKVHSLGLSSEEFRQIVGAIEVKR